MSYTRRLIIPNFISIDLLVGRLDFFEVVEISIFGDEMGKSAASLPTRRVGSTHAERLDDF